MTPIGYLETSVIFRGDNLDVLADFPDECIDLVYLDPPFFSNRQYEVIWGDEAETGWVVSCGSAGTLRMSFAVT